MSLRELLSVRQKALMNLDRIPILKVSRFLGHARQSVTETIYSHLLDIDELDEIAGFFDDFKRRKKHSQAHPPPAVEQHVSSAQADRSARGRPHCTGRRYALATGCSSDAHDPSRKARQSAPCIAPLS
jgi:hypothetical protein